MKLSQRSSQPSGQTAALPTRDSMLLHLAERIVPLADRSDWLRCWTAELWHTRHPRCRTAPSANDLYAGLLRDALWLRTESYRQSLSGTATLCLLYLGTVFLLAALPLLASTGSTRALVAFVSASASRFLCQASLVTLVSFATGARLVQNNAPAVSVARVRANLFQFAKVVLVLLSAFLLSTDLAQPLRAPHPFCAGLLQPQAFVLFVLLGLRWSFGDTQQRCKQCLRALDLPARVGRPSWNFMDSNGTELHCKSGHGLLSVPELETSWCRSSRWLTHPPGGTSCEPHPAGYQMR